MNVVKAEHITGRDFLSLESRRQLFDEEALTDDLAVLFGLVVAGRVAPRLEGNWLEATAAELRYRVDAAVSSGQVSAEDWSLLHQLWYRWRIPFGAASLAWWQLYCLALAQAGDAQTALDSCENWISQIEGAELDQRPGMFTALTGVPATAGIVALHDDISSLRHFAAAALERLPIIRVSSAADVERLRNLGYRIAHCDLDPGDAAPTFWEGVPSSRLAAIGDLGRLCLGRWPAFGGLIDDARRQWAERLPEERTSVLLHLEQRISALEQVRISRGGMLTDNGGIAELLARCRSKALAEWTPTELRIATLMAVWQDAGFVLQEMNQAELSLPLLLVFLERRIAEYQQVVTKRIAGGSALTDLAQQFAAIRTQVERTHLRCLYFDGGNWERREFLLARADCAEVVPIPAALAEAMERRFGHPFPDLEPSTAWKTYLGTLLEASYSPTDLIIALAEWAANAADLPVDYAIFTVPLGVKLDEPWMMELDEVFCYTAIRSDFDPKSHGVPLRPVGIRNAIAQRMRYNVVKKAQNYALVKRMKPQSFNLPDIAISEDAHQGGHFAAGVRHASRVPMTIHHCGSEWKGIADVRLNRVWYESENRFQEGELLIATRYGAWAKAIADEAFARGLLFDRMYCDNLDDGRDIAAKLGRS